MATKRIPNPGELLPAEGVTEVLVQAAQTHPVIALLLVGIIICVGLWLTCWVIVKSKFYDVLKSPEASRALVEMKKMENAHGRAMAKIKKGKG